MNKILGLCIALLISFNTAFCADMSFVQVDTLCLSAKDEQSILKMQNIIEKINNQKNIEFVVFTGDNIESPKKENLECFIKNAKKLKKPYYVVLGSKDISKQKHLGKKEYINFLKQKSKYHKKILGPNFVVEKKDIAFICLDGSKDVITTPMGYYREATLDWLENQLSYYSDKNIVIFQHFPLIAPSRKETRYTIKPEAYLDLLKQYGNVKAIFAGNFNVNSEKEVEGVLHVTTADAPQYRVVDMMDYETEKPTFWSVIKE